MKQFTFNCAASVSVDAETEKEARQKLSDAPYSQDEDVYYGDPLSSVVSVYVFESVIVGESAALVDVSFLSES
jgi:hypothetical protein